MKNGKRSYIFLLVLGKLILFSSSAYGVGYEITEQNARAMGLASAFVAQADNPSAVYYNPAGLTRIKKATLSAGVTQVQLDIKFKNNGVSETDKTRTFYVPNFYLSVPLVEDKLTMGLGVYAPYGLGTEWDEDGPTRYSAVKSEIQTVFITPALAWKPIPQISLGAGVSYIQSEAVMTKKYPFSIIAPAYSLVSNDADVSLKGNAQNWGWTAGIQAYPTDKLSLGFSYRSETVLKYKGSLHVYNISPAAQALGASSTSYYDTDVKTELPLPQRFSLGIAYKLMDNWTAEFDYERTRWSSLNTLDIKLDDENAFFTDSKTKKDWRDTNSFKLGTEVIIAKYWAIRSGGFYYQTPVPDKSLDPMVPDADRYGFTLGGGYKVGSFRVDLGYMEVFSPPRSVKNDELEANDNTVLKPAGLTPGRDRYENRSRLIAISLSYNY